MKNHPKAIELFIKWFENNENLCELDQDYFIKDLEILSLENDIIFNFDNSFFKKYIFFNRGSLFEFFDEQKIYIESKKDIGVTGFYCNIGFYSTEVYPTRFQSLNEAFQIAFKLLEEKL